MEKGKARTTQRGRSERGEDYPGILIAAADSATGAGRSSKEPRICAFIWGERTDRAPTLPFGRWRRGP